MCKYCTTKELDNHFRLVRESADYRNGYMFALKTVGNMVGDYVHGEIRATEFMLRKAEERKDDVCVD